MSIRVHLPFHSSEVGSSHPEKPGKVAPSSEQLTFARQEIKRGTWETFR